jgi:putative radical SAM enzyme (TIGR03279 family)
MIKHEIANILKNSIAAEMGIARGDFLHSINGEEVKDIFDYRFRIQDENLVVEIEKQSGDIWEIVIEKEADEDLGILFKQSLMCNTKRCRNKCVFCFVDQQPKGLRPSLYVKDDDPLLSFLLGNYVTLTNLNEAEIKRLAGYHLSPLRISVHAADLDLREKMMGTSAARNLHSALQIFNEAGIEMHFQIVLCKNLNDGAQLDNTIKTLAALQPGAKSLAIVPAGLTRHREGLFPLEPFTKNDAKKIIEQVEKFQTKQNFVFLSDEWYILAEKSLPKYKYYGNFPQLDNGVGVLRLFERGFAKGIAQKEKRENFVFQIISKIFLRKNKPVNIGIVTGEAAGHFIRGIAAMFMQKHFNVKIHVHVIGNNFFGSSVTVSGLLTGQDVIRQLKDKLGGTKTLFLPENAFRSGVKEKVMLDGTTKEELEQKLNVRIVIGSTNGFKFYKQLKSVARV